MIVLNTHHYVSMRGPPATHCTIVVEIRSQTMTKKQHCPFLVGVLVINMKRGIFEHRHLKLKQKRYNIAKETVGESIGGWVDVENIIYDTVVFFRRNPFWTFAIGH